MKHPKPLILALGLALAQTAGADSTLEYLVVDSGAKTAKPQDVVIKDGKVMVKGAGGDPNMDILYSSNPEQVFIVDHRKRTVTTVDENQVNRLAEQTEAVQPLLAGVGEQLAKLDPKQRAKWEGILGGKIDLNAIAEAAQAAKPAQTASIVKTGKGLNVAGVACEQMDVFQGKTKAAEICLADPARLNLSGADYATIRSLLDLSGRLANRTQGLARQFGVNIPNLDLQDLAGVPVEIRDVSKQNQGILTLNRIITSAVSPEAVQIPQDYRMERFDPWK